MENRTSAESSRALNEALYGTIKPANIWFLLEYNGVYTDDAWGDARIPVAVKATLEGVKKSRPLLIRQPKQANAIDRRVSLFVVNAAAENPHYFHLFLNQYEDILNLNMDAVLAGKLVPAETEPLYIVCTNGKRDICCARYGTALYDALSQVAGDSVWQCSHIGGHRFAGTMLCFPVALCYGFLDAVDAPQLVSSYKRESILLKKLRGHAIYPQPVQVAEYFLRHSLNNSAFDDFKLLNYEGDEDKGAWQVNFRVKGKSHRVDIAAAEALMVLSTTGDKEFSPVPQYKLVAINS
jgi:hypothetical protein